MMMMIMCDDDDDWPCCSDPLQNIELKVEVESLKQELQEKQQLLDKALWVHKYVSSLFIKTR